MSSESSKPSVPEGQPDSRAALLQRCWGLVESGLLAQAPAIFQDVHLALARSGKDELVRLGRELSLQMNPLVQAYRAAVRDGHERAVEAFLGGPKAASVAVPGVGLSLMAMDETDISGQVEQASARLRDLLQEAWSELAARLQSLGAGSLSEVALPLFPGIFIQAAAQGLGLGDEAPSALVRNLPVALAPSLGTTYESISRLLAASGIEARAPARATPVLRPSGPATAHRPVAPAVRGDATGMPEEPRLSVDIEITSTPARKAAAGRTAPIPEHEVPDQQPDAWGMREYARLQALFGVNVSVLLDGALLGLQDESAAAPVRPTPSRNLISAMTSAQKLDAAHAAGLVRRLASAEATDKRSTTTLGRGATAEPAAKVNGEVDTAPASTREYSQRLIGLAGLPIHKHTVHLASRLFARMERDRIVPEAVRAQLVALRFSFMEVALADPSIFVRPEHAARLLINAIASSSVAWTADGPGARRHLQQVHAAVQYVLGAPGAAPNAFVQAHAQFGQYLAEQARRTADGPLDKAREVLRGAEERESQGLEVGAFLANLLTGAPLDSVLRQFLLRDWARVLVDAAQDEALEPGVLARRLSLVPDLVWSAQPVGNAKDRKRFTEVVPVMLENLRDGVTGIGWSGRRLKELVDHLRQVHANSLAAAEAAPTDGFSVSTLRIRLDGFRMQALAGPPRLKPFELVEEAVMRFLETHDGGVSHRRAPKPSAPSVLERGPAEQLIDRWRPTTWFDLRIGRAAQRVRLEGFTPSRSLALFSTQAEPPLVSMSHESLVACLCHAWISPVEPVPMIARAFRTVLSDLKRTAQAASEGGHPGG